MKECINNTEKCESQWTLGRDKKRYARSTTQRGRCGRCGFYWDGHPQRLPSFEQKIELSSQKTRIESLQLQVGHIIHCGGLH
jgi:hypothetical protein